MIERHQSDRRLITTERLAQFSQVQGGPDPGLAKDASETNSSIQPSPSSRLGVNSNSDFYGLLLDRLRLQHLRHLGQVRRLVTILSLPHG